MDINKFEIKKSNEKLDQKEYFEQLQKKLHSYIYSLGLLLILLFTMAFNFNSILMILFIGAWFLIYIIDTVW